MIPLLEIHDFSLERLERKATPHHLENEKYFIANQKHDTGGIVAGLHFTQSDIPADDDAVARPECQRGHRSLAIFS